MLVFFWMLIQIRINKCSILYIILLRLVISFADSNRSNTDEFLIFSLVVVPFIALGNSSLTTVLFSHGLLLALFVSSQIRKHEIFIIYWKMATLA